jgi:hypothetical protein
MKIDESMKKEIKEAMEKIQAPSSLYEFAKNINEESEKRADFEIPTGRKRGSWKFKYVAAAVVSLGFLMGSVFLNPTMAEMASKIPYLGQMFQTKPIHEVIPEALEKEGYKSAGIGMISGEKPLIEVRLEGSKEYVDQEEDKVLKIVTGILDGRGYDNYELVISAINQGVDTPPTGVEKQQMVVLGEKLEEGLKKAGYPIQNVDPFNPIIIVNIPFVDEAKEVEIQKAAIELVKANGSSKEVTLSREASYEESEWLDVMKSIYEGFFMKKEYRITGISSNYKPGKMTITISTSMKPSDAEAKKTVDKIRKEITEFLDSEEGITKTANQKYELIVSDEKGKDFPF